MLSVQLPPLPAASSILALAAPHFVTLFLLPYSIALSSSLFLHPQIDDRAWMHRPYLHKPVFLAVAAGACLYGTAGVVELVGLGVGGDSGSSWSAAGNVLEISGRLVGSFSMLYLLYRYGPRKQKHGDVTSTLSVSLLILLASLIIASSALSFIHASTTYSGKTAMTSAALALVVAVLQVAAFVLVAAAHSNQSRPIGRLRSTSHSRTHSQHSQMFLTAQWARNPNPPGPGVPPSFSQTSASEAPHPSRVRSRRAKGPVFSTTIREFLLYILVVQSWEIVAAVVRIIECALTGPAARQHDGLRDVLGIFHAVFEVLWLVGVLHLYFVLSRPRHKAQDQECPLDPQQELRHGHADRASFSPSAESGFSVSPTTPAPTTTPTLTIPRSVSEEFLASASSDPFSSPAPGTVVIKNHSSTHSHRSDRRRRGSIGDDESSDCATSRTGDHHRQTSLIPPVPSIPLAYASSRSQKSEKTSANSLANRPTLGPQLKPLALLHSIGGARTTQVIQARGTHPNPTTPSRLHHKARAMATGRLSLDLGGSKRRRSVQTRTQKAKDEGHRVTVAPESLLVVTSRPRPPRPSMPPRYRSDLGGAGGGRACEVVIPEGVHEQAESSLMETLKFLGPVIERSSDLPSEENDQVGGTHAALPSNRATSNRLGLTFNSTPSPPPKGSPLPSSLHGSLSPSGSMVSMYLGRDQAGDGTRSGSPTPVALSKRRPSNDSQSQSRGATSTTGNEEFLSVIVMNALMQRDAVALPVGKSDTTDKRALGVPEIDDADLDAPPSQTPTPLERTPRASRVPSVGSSLVHSRHPSPGRVDKVEQSHGLEEKSDCPPVVPVVAGFAAKSAETGAPLPNEHAAVLPAQVFRPSRIASVDAEPSPPAVVSNSHSQPSSLSSLRTPFESEGLQRGTVTSDQIISPFAATPQLQREARRMYQLPTSHEYSNFSSSHQPSQPIPIPSVRPPPFGDNGFPLPARRMINFDSNPTNGRRRTLSLSYSTTPSRDGGWRVGQRASGNSIDSSRNHHGVLRSRFSDPSSAGQSTASESEKSGGRAPPYRSRA